MSARAGKIAGMDTDTLRHSDGDAALSSGLDAFLSAVDRAGSWRVERVVKSSPFETTEVVYFVGAGGGELGPFVRKRIDCSAGVGSAYERLWEIQRRGNRSRSVPRIVECTRCGDALTVVMEYIEGPTLEAFVARQGHSSALACEIGVKLCDAVSDLHTRFDPPLIHRDLKPSNIIVSDGEPVIIDFGIARTWTEGAAADTVHFGTRSYAPPEQFGFGQTDVRSDVYALGKLLAFCATGAEPSVSTDADALVRAGVDGALAAVIARATAFDPDARFRSAGELKAALIDVRAAPSPEAMASAVSSAAVAPAVPAAVPAVAPSIATASRASAVAPAAPVTPAVRDASVHPSVSHGRSLAAAQEGDRRGVSRPRWYKRISIPRPIGDVWNIFVLLTYAAVIATCVEQLSSPAPEYADYPFWFLVLEYVLCFGVGFAAIGYLLLDKRRLRSWIKPLARVPRKLEFAVCLGILVWSYLFTVIVGLAIGVGAT